MPHVALPAMPTLYQRLAANDLVLANFGFKIRDRKICTLFEAVPSASTFYRAARSKWRFFRSLAIGAVNA